MTNDAKQRAGGTHIANSYYNRRAKRSCLGFLTHRVYMYMSVSYSPEFLRSLILRFFEDFTHPSVCVYMCMCVYIERVLR